MKPSLDLATNAIPLLRDLLLGAGANNGIDLRVRTWLDRHRCEELWFENGELVEWTHSANSITVDLELEVAEACFVRSLLGWMQPNSAAVSWRVRDAAGGTPFPPGDVRSAVLGTSLPFIPDASVSASYTLVGSPFGDLTYSQDFRDGRRAEWAWGSNEKADVRLRISYENHLRARIGHLSVIEQLEGGTIDGEWEDLMVLAGITESDEYVSAMRRGSSSVLAVAQFAELMSGPHMLSARAMAAASLMKDYVPPNSYLPTP